MSRTTRAAALTGLTATTMATGLLLAPAALAAPLPAPTAPSTVLPGQPFQVSGTGCVADDPAHPDWEAAVVLVTDTADLEGDEPTGVFLADPADDGSWWAHVTFPESTTGTHSVYAACATTYAGEPVEYPEITVNVTSTPTEPRFPVTPPYTGPTPTSEIPLSALTGKVRGTQENTPGVASPDNGSATGDSATPGRKVVKVLTGFRPDEVVKVTLHSTPQTMGTFPADQNGTVTVEFTVPAGTPAGEHTLVYEGNMGTYFQEALTVTAAAATSNASSSSLAYTGADVALPLGLGVGALALGGGLVFAARRRSAEGSQA
jgi:hypothetical protein